MKVLLENAAEPGPHRKALRRFLAQRGDELSGLNRNHHGETTVEECWSSRVWTTDDNQSVIKPVFQQIKITSDQEWMNHIVPAETLHDRLDWAGLKVMGGGTGHIKCQ